MKHIPIPYEKKNTLKQILKRFKLLPERVIVYGWDLSIHHAERMFELSFTGVVLPKKKKRRRRK
jgi:hypothetical protein